MELRIKHSDFESLSVYQLYDILKLRSEVFVVEQTCVYQDMDDADQDAIHVWGSDNKNIVTYARIKPKKNAVSIGRVVTSSKYRGKGLGQETMTYCLQLCKENWPEKEIELSSQKYLVKFYENLGFGTIGEPYLEDGIPHIAMKLKLNE